MDDIGYKFKCILNHFVLISGKHRIKFLSWISKNKY